MASNKSINKFVDNFVNSKEGQKIPILFKHKQGLTKEEIKNGLLTEKYFLIQNPISKKTATVDYKTSIIHKYLLICLLALHKSNYKNVKLEKKINKIKSWFLLNREELYSDFID